MLESFGKEYFGSLNKELEDGNYKGYTPFLDSLVSESLVYKYSFANGQQSIDGLPSILSGIPRFVEPFFLTPASLNKLSSVGGELKKKGYYTAFSMVRETVLWAFRLMHVQWDILIISGVRSMGMMMILMGTGLFGMKNFYSSLLIR